MEEPFDFSRRRRRDAGARGQRPAGARRRFGERVAAERTAGWFGAGELRLMLLGGIALGLVAAVMPWEDWNGAGDGAAIGSVRGVAGTAAGGAAAAPAIRFALCHSGGGTNCVVDGDTFWMAGEKIRIADIDAPETHPPRCAEEARLGEAATLKLQALLSAGPVTLLPIDRDEDRYGRKLREVEAGGVAVGATLVDAGLARWYEGGRRGWCG